MGPIPFTAIVEYFTIYELEDFDEFLSVMRRMDQAFMEVSASAIKPKEPGNASTNADKKNPNKG